MNATERGLPLLLALEAIADDGHVTYFRDLCRTNQVSWNIIQPYGPRIHFRGHRQGTPTTIYSCFVVSCAVMLLNVRGHDGVGRINSSLVNGENLKVTEFRTLASMSGVSQSLLLVS